MVKSVCKISVLTWIAPLFSIFFIYGCTQKIIPNTQLPPEPEKITETDSVQNFISAEYCFHKEFENDSTWKWDFSPYKINNPLNLKLPEMCEHSYSYSVEIGSKDSSWSLLDSVVMRI